MLGVGLESMSEDAPRGIASTWTPPSVEELAERFPELELLELLGRGGMGAVYKARQKALDRLVAVKILPPEIGENPAFADRFAREAQALARLNHPNIVTVHDFGERDGLYFFMMEFVDGVTLRQLLETGRVSSREALAIVPQICDALQCAHDQGIVHRDIKPENILMDRQGNVKIADFGLAKLVFSEEEMSARAAETDADGSVHTLAAVGTPAYMAPEQVEHPGEVDHRADIYALGVVFYQMLTGELPGKELEPPSRRGVQIDVRLDEIVLQALEKNPQRRYSQISILKTRVEDVSAAMAASKPPSVSRLGTASPSIRESRRSSTPGGRTCGEPDPSAAPATTRRTNTKTVQAAIAGILTVILAGIIGTVGYLINVVPKAMAVWADEERALDGSQQLMANASRLCQQSGFFFLPVLLLGFVGALAWLVMALRGMRKRGRWVLLLGLGVAALLTFAELKTTLSNALAPDVPERDEIPTSPEARAVDAAEAFLSAVAEGDRAALGSLVAPAIQDEVFNSLDQFSEGDRDVLRGLRIRSWNQWVYHAIALTHPFMALDKDHENVMLFRLKLSQDGWVIDKYESSPADQAKDRYQELRSWTQLRSSMARHEYRNAPAGDHPTTEQAAERSKQQTVVRENAMLFWAGIAGVLLLGFPLTIAAVVWIAVGAKKGYALGRAALTLSVFGLGLGCLCVVLHVGVAAFSVVLGGCETAALIMGLRSWKTRAGKAAVIVVLSVGLLTGLALFKQERALSGHPAPLARSPHRLRSLPTEQVIEAGLADPESPWVWQELEERAEDNRLTAKEAGSTVAGLTAWIERSKGRDQPLNWKGGLLTALHRKHLLTDTQQADLLVALHGEPRIDRLPRIRTDVRRLTVTGSLSCTFDRNLFDAVLLNEIRSVTLDGTPVSMQRTFFGGNHPRYQVRLDLPKLEPGAHTVAIEVESGLFAGADVVGLDQKTAAKDWPAAKRRWTRTGKAELLVYDEEAEVVTLVDTPELNPRRDDGLSIKTVSIHSAGAGSKARATIVFVATTALQVPVSADISLRLGEATFPCGSLWVFSRKTCRQMCAMDHRPRTPKCLPLRTESREAG